MIKFKCYATAVLVSLAALAGCKDSDQPAQVKATKIELTCYKAGQKVFVKRGYEMYTGRSGVLKMFQMTDRGKLIIYVSPASCDYIERRKGYVYETR